MCKGYGDPPCSRPTPVTPTERPRQACRFTAGHVLLLEEQRPDGTWPFALRLRGQADRQPHADRQRPERRHSG